jgi:hypothetical protein
LRTFQLSEEGDREALLVVSIAPSIVTISYVVQHIMTNKSMNISKVTQIALGDDDRWQTYISCNISGDSRSL